MKTLWLYLKWPYDWIVAEIKFRKLEEKVSIKILKLKNKVVSLGGGAFLNENISSLLTKTTLATLYT